MCFGENLGREQNGSGHDFSRPVLVVKRFNNSVFWIVPLSSKQKLYDFYYNFTDPNLVPVSAVLAQLRVVSILRFKRFMYELQLEVYENLRANLFSL